MAGQTFSPDDMYVKTTTREELYLAVTSSCPNTAKRPHQNKNSRKRRQNPYAVQHTPHTTAHMHNLANYLGLRPTINRYLQSWDGEAGLVSADTTAPLERCIHRMDVYSRHFAEKLLKCSGNCSSKYLEQRGGERRLVPDVPHHHLQPGAFLGILASRQHGQGLRFVPSLMYRVASSYVSYNHFSRHDQQNRVGHSVL